MLDNTQDVSNSLPGGLPEQQAQQERVYKESELNDIVGKKKHHAYLKGKQDAMAEFQQSQQAPQQQQVQTSGFEQDMRHPGMSPEQIRQAVSEEMQRAQHDAMLQHMHNDFYSRVASGADKHEDFAQVIKPFLIDNKVHPDIVALANSVDNTADVVYDLAKNPYKIASLLQLSSHPSTHHLAQAEMQRLSTSIKSNDAAKNVKQPPEPSSQLTSSYTGSDNGSYTVEDLKKMDWMRG